MTIECVYSPIQNKRRLRYRILAYLDSISSGWRTRSEISMRFRASATSTAINASLDDLEAKGLIIRYRAPKFGSHKQEQRFQLDGEGWKEARRAKEERPWLKKNQNKPKQKLNRGRPIKTLHSKEEDVESAETR